MRAPAFFPRRLDPVLGGGEGGEDPVVAPEVPGRGPVRQAILGHEADGQGDDALGVMAAGRRQVGEVGAEVDAAGGAAVLGVDDVEVAWAAPARAAEVVEGSLPQGVAVATATAPRTATAAVTA